MSKIINSYIVKPIKGTGPTTKNVRGYDLVQEPYANILLCGGKKSGKTVTIYRMLEEFCYRNNVIIFASTVHNDVTYKKMIKMLEKKHCNVMAYDHFIEDGVNHLEELVDLLRDKEEEKEKDKEKPKEIEVYKGPIFNNMVEKKESEEPKEPKPNKSKPLTAEYVIVYDDLSSDMRSNAVYKMLTKNRHFKCKNIISIHNLNDLLPGSYQNLDVLLLFGNINKDKIEELQDKAGLSYRNDSKDNSVLWDSYKYCTEEKYNFLYIDRANGGLRCNFNEKLLV